MEGAVAECSAPTASSPIAVGQKDDLMARWWKPPRSWSRPPTPRQAEGSKDWEIAGKASCGSTPQTRHRQDGYGIDVKLPGMLNAALKTARCSAAS